MKKSVLVINKNGKIIEILEDDFSVIKNSNNFHELINSESYSIFFDMMHKLAFGNRIKNLSIRINQNNNENSVFFINAFKINDDNLVVTMTTQLLNRDKTIISIIELYNLEKAPDIGDNIANDYDDLSRLNNKLINIQREFSRTNFKLETLNIQLKSIIESIQEYLVLVDLKGEIIISNSNYNSFFNEDQNIFRFIKNNNKYLYQKFMAQTNHKEYLYLNDIKLAAHMDRFFDVKIVPIYNEDGEKKYFVITFDDVTKRMKNIRKLRNLKMAFDQSKENIAITDINHKIIFSNQSFISEYGFSKEEEVLNKDIRNLIEKTRKPNENELIDREIFYNKRMNGEYFPVEISKSEVEFGKEINSYIYFIKNIADQLNYEEKLIVLAKKDQMTGAYSREAGLAYLNDFLSRDDKQLNNISILFLDINALKKVNDNFGHQQGDELIKQVVEIMNESTRKNDIVARLGGDEFLIILPDSDYDNAKMIKNRINNDAQEKNDEKEYLVAVSIGIATASEIDNKNIDELINLADRRMYEEKKKFYKKSNKNPR